MLNWRKSGAGPPLVMIHGLFGSLENLAGIGRSLSEVFSVYSLDLPNHGASDPLSNGDLAQYAAAVGQWLGQQALEQPIILGHSLGGKVAMELALSEPDKMAKLVVLDISPAAYSDRHGEVFNGLEAVDRGDIQNRAQADYILRDYVEEAAVRSFLLKNLARQEGKFKWRINLPELRQSYPRLIQANRAGVFDKPVLFVKGGRSDYIKEASKEDILQRFPRAQVRVVEETGHWLHAEKPKLVARVIARFAQTD